jgi:hypothetical protein
MRQRSALVASLCFPLLFSLLLAAEEKLPTPASETVRQALSSQDHMVDLLEKYTYRKHIISETTDMKGRVTGHEERVYSYAPCDGKTCITLESVDGKPPTPKQLKEHEKMMKKEWERQAKKTAEDRKKEDDEDLFLSKDFLAVYDFASGGSELHEGTAAEIFSFTPKDEKVQLTSNNNKVLSKLAGRLWIADVDHKIVAAEMHMVKPIKVWGGFAGAINAMTVQQEYVPDAAGMYLPKKNAIEMELRILFSKARLKLTEEYSEFKAPAAPGPPVPAAVKQ